jgi:hypothetical protein
MNHRFALFLALLPFFGSRYAFAQTTEPASASVPSPPPTPPVEENPSLVPWGFWFGIGGQKVWGTPIPASGISGPGGAFSMWVDFSYRFLYAGAGFSVVWFNDDASFTQAVQDQYGRSAVLESSSASGAGFIEAGLVHRFVIPFDRQDGLGLQPAVGYGIEGITAPTRTIGNCVDCASQTVGDYNGGQYVRFQLGLYLASKAPTSTMYGYVGLVPSFQYFVVRSDPGITSVLDIALSVGFAR